MTDAASAAPLNVLLPTLSETDLHKYNNNAEFH